MEMNIQPQIIPAAQQMAPQKLPGLNKGRKRKRNDDFGSQSKSRELELKKRGGKAMKLDGPGEANILPSSIPRHKSEQSGLPNGDGKTESHTGALQRLPLRKQLQQPQRHANITSQHPQSHLLKRRDALLPIRKALPIWPHAESIRAALRKNNVLVLTGETGSGKSTQVPQFLFSEKWCTKCIAITQPRRVAAISLARRVAEEMGSLFGSQGPAAQVGYSVRFDNATGPNARVKFLTEGMLLQEMLRDPELGQYSAVVVDEVHERSVNVDLILGFLKNLLEVKSNRRKAPLKIVIMSATADVESLVRFFGNGLQSSENGSQHSGAASRVGNGDDVQSESSWSGILSDEEPTANADSIKASRNDLIQKPLSSLPEATHVSTCFVEGRQYPVKTIYLSEPTQDFVEGALKMIFQIHYKEPLPGDILVFLTGQEIIESLEKLVNEYAQKMEKEVPKLLALPLFAALPQDAQQRIFTPAPHRTRKVILATNIAETSVTVSGVRFVIDCGKSKIKQFRNRLGLESLLVKPISKSAAIQRKGRAGREAPGQCYRLYTEDSYNGLEERTMPEILRCDLSHSILMMKARGVDDVVNFPFLDRPPGEALEKALLQLLHLGALTEIGTISEIGLKMSKLPLTPTLGRILLEAAAPERDCLLEVIDIISALSVETNIFLNLVSEERKEEAEAARRDLYKRAGDHMTLLTTVQRYAEENSDRKAWCERHFVSHRAMQNVMNIRKQLRQQCTQLKLLPPSSISSPTSSMPSESHTQNILHCFLRGFLANTATLMPDGSYRTLMYKQTVAIHPSSVMFGRKTEAIVFSEFVFTTKAWAKGVSAVQNDWVGDIVGKVFGC
ncbi:P-loop containing nucleoside triphosphate hydrolase protein [Lindgomyces ingoldianus]|uniref:P-loop containing nucleoside triphosphate hydrolase protein n=1 Tax=Lindgomyces ingoldianus TaxID=673940 RepID=A0ACB6QHS2_9PLEO|nr:P-loop containing nucleoside triphosphate hydrolase protein [Lindgomyces ingoldianus]KAF2466518.1 P-loop containing nucleoside triphosphate hydrolase protein [Lindgomyces ingoldianus]